MKKQKAIWLGRPGTQYTLAKGKERVVFHHWNDTNEISWKHVSGDATKQTLVVHSTGDWTDGLDTGVMQAFAEAKLGA